MKRENSFVSMGIVSLFLIFSVFVMVVLCLLTYSTSSSDYISSKSAMEETAAYYEACSRATDMYAALAEELTALTSEKEEADFYEALSSSNYPEDIQYEEETAMYSITCPFSDTQELVAQFHVSYQQGANPLTLSSWKTRITGEWIPDLHQNVFKKE